MNTLFIEVCGGLGFIFYLKRGPPINSNGGIDAHPFARGSVIEVLFDLDGDAQLCDIIDRAPSDTPNHAITSYRWKYYIHYRDFNRRMDEWITDPGRIVNPPSVGNAKVRIALKSNHSKGSDVSATAPKRKRDDNNNERPRLVRSSSRRSSLNNSNEGDGSINNLVTQSTGNSDISDWKSICHMCTAKLRGPPRRVQPVL